MSFHVLAYEEAIGTTANTDLDAVADDIIVRQNDHFFPSVDLQLLWATAMSANMNRSRIVSPTLRQVTNPQIRPIINAATPGDDEAVADYRSNPFRLPRLEEIAVESSSDICMGTEQALALLGVTAGMQPAPAGNVFTLRGTSSTASVALTWTSVTTTWDDTLPEGRYAVVGLTAVGATEVAARLIFDEQMWRPGATAVAAIGNRIPALFQKGGLGMWGMFNSWAMPIVQVLNTAAVSTHTFFLDIVRVA